MISRRARRKCEMDYKAGGRLRDMTERDALLSVSDELVRIP